MPINNAFFDTLTNGIPKPKPHLTTPIPVALFFLRVIDRVSFLFTLAAPLFRLEPQARQESRLVCNAFGARLHDAGLVASGKPQLGCSVGGRYSEEKGGGA